MGASSFDTIANAILEQQFIMEKLKEENSELRRQLVELRSGKNIFVEIGEHRIALSQLFLGEEIPPTLPVEQIPEVIEPVRIEAEVAAPAITSSLAETTNSASTEALQDTNPRVPVVPEQALITNEQESDIEALATREQPNVPSSFLEDMIIDEFSAAMTNPIAVWNGPSKKPDIIDEEKKAALRKELMGSFLLE